MGPPGARLALVRMRRGVLSPPSPALGPAVLCEGSCPRAGYEAPGWTHPSTPEAGLWSGLTGSLTGDRRAGRSRVTPEPRLPEAGARAVGWLLRRPLDERLVAKGGVVGRSDVRRAEPRAAVPERNSPRRPEENLPTDPSRPAPMRCPCLLPTYSQLRHLQAGEALRAGFSGGLSTNVWRPAPTRETAERRAAGPGHGGDGRRRGWCRPRRGRACRRRGRGGGSRWHDRRRWWR